uniref:Uncharacterized protein n=1 Tax=Panagrolaimus davidi TaxID=227884 RepID=A0A914QHX1_9BILA
MSPEVKECLKTLFEVCQELMKENNETNPWEISLSAFILPIISGINDEIENEVKDLLEKVKRCDPQRREMYESTENKIVLTNVLNQKIGEQTVLETLFLKDGKFCLEFNDYSCLRPLAGLIRLYTESTYDLPFVIQAERRWFLTVNGE